MDYVYLQSRILMLEQPQGLLVGLGSKGLLIFKDTLFVTVFLMLRLICFFLTWLEFWYLAYTKPYKHAQSQANNHPAVYLCTNTILNHIKKKNLFTSGSKKLKQECSKSVIRSPLIPPRGALLSLPRAWSSTLYSYGLSCAEVLTAVQAGLMHNSTHCYPALTALQPETTMSGGSWSRHVWQVSRVPGAAPVVHTAATGTI